MRRLLEEATQADRCGAQGGLRQRQGIAQIVAGAGHDLVPDSNDPDGVYQPRYIAEQGQQDV
jgi:hypothetical protein